MTDIKIHPMIEKVANTIPDPVPRDDKSNINCYLYDLDQPDDQDGISVIKGFAAESIGMMARKYGAKFIIICGALPHLKSNLESKHNHVIMSVARACTKIAYSDGAMELTNNGFPEILLNITKNKDIPFHVKMECTRAYGWIKAMTEVEKEKEVYRLLR